MTSNDDITTGVLNILLADDDKDDCLFFKEALEELPLVSNLTTVHNGEQLIQLLTKKTVQLPDVLFLDLNMPRKNGFTCLEEIKSDHKLSHVPVIILSTLFDENIANRLYKNGALFYICKPPDFHELKKVINLALTLVAENSIPATVQRKIFAQQLIITRGVNKIEGI
jgi:CheY-like chemotaxis protein